MVAFVETMGTDIFADVFLATLEKDVRRESVSSCFLIAGFDIDHRLIYYVYMINYMAVSPVARKKKFLKELYPGFVTICVRGP